MANFHLRASLVAMTIAGGMAGASFGAAVPAAGATASFLRAQRRLEQRLANRAAELNRLSADVKAATQLSTSDAATLEARLSAERTSIATLAVTVAQDTSLHQLMLDQRAMYRDDRVYAVMVPQVLEAIEADGISAQIATMQAGEATLQADVASLAGQPGYRSAAQHYEAFVVSVTNAWRLVINLDAKVIAQIPADFPRDTRVFVDANRQLLAADVTLAHASYDETLVGLASGGSTGA